MGEGSSIEMVVKSEEAAASFQRVRSNQKVGKNTSRV